MNGVFSRDHVLLAHIIPIRRCNLACAYCNEYDKSSPPVSTDVMLSRIDRLAELKTAIIVVSGGEPLLHPELEKIVERIRSNGAIAGLITNGYLLTARRIRALNEAGLDYVQISIDNVEPDDVSMKSLKVLDRKLQLLAELAEFSVNINSVVGGGIRDPEGGIQVARRAVQLGFSTSTGIIHDDSGHLKPLSDAETRAFRQMNAIGRRGHTRFNSFQRNLARGRPNRWRCRAGARYLYICENGLVHYCSQQRGYPGVPLVDYTLDDMRREFVTEKPCAPMCTIGCVQQIALLDNWRAPQSPASTGIPRPELQPDT